MPFINLTMPLFDNFRQMLLWSGGLESDDHQVRSCHPRGWSGARVGVGMLRGGRAFPWLTITRFQSVLVSWLLGFKVSWFQSFKVSKSQWSRITKIPFHVSGRYWSHIQYFLKTLLDRSWGFFGPRLFNKKQMLDFQKNESSKYVLENDSNLVLELFGEFGRLQR